MSLSLPSLPFPKPRVPHCRATIPHLPLPPLHPNPPFTLTPRHSLFPNYITRYFMLTSCEHCSPQEFSWQLFTLVFLVVRYVESYQSPEIVAGEATTGVTAVSHKEESRLGHQEAAQSRAISATPAAVGLSFTSHSPLNLSSLCSLSEAHMTPVMPRREEKRAPTYEEMLA